MGRRSAALTLVAHDYGRGEEAREGIGRALVSRGSRWLVFGLIVMGWALWLCAVVILLSCERLQSGMIANPGDPCAGLGWGVFGGFVFLLVTSVVALNYSSKHRRRQDEEWHQEWQDLGK
jgi:hypothetical protein